MKMVKIKKGQLLAISRLISEVIEKDREKQVLSDGLANRMADFVVRMQSTVKMLEDEQNGLVASLGSPVYEPPEEGKEPVLKGHRVEGENVTEFKRRSTEISLEEIDIELPMIPGHLFDELNGDRLFSFDQYLVMMPIIEN